MRVWRRACCMWWLLIAFRCQRVDICELSVRFSRLNGFVDSGIDFSFVGKGF